MIAASNATVVYRSTGLAMKDKPRAGKKKLFFFFLILLNCKYPEPLQIIQSKFKRACEKWGNEDLCSVDLSGRKKQRSEGRSDSQSCWAAAGAWWLHGQELRRAGVRGEEPRPRPLQPLVLILVMGREILTAGRRAPA